MVVGVIKIFIDTLYTPLKHSVHASIFLEFEYGMGIREQFVIIRL